MDSELDRRLARLADREEILDLVRRERFARDQRHFGVMRDCFHPEAHVRSSWYDGTAEDYVAATREWMERPGNGKHWVFPAFVQTEGDRATVESPAMIFNRILLDDVEVDFHVFSRFFSRVLRREGAWRLASFEVIFERDIMRPVKPTDVMPIDWEVLATFRPSYKFLTWVQESRGVCVNRDLYGDDRREQLDAFYSAENQWLAGADSA
jgi:hypothetical protein